jgi:hypothetical protein
MESQKGVKETLDVLDFLVSMGNTVKAVKDPESAGGTNITMAEYASFIPLVLKVQPMVEGIGEVDDELLYDTITEDEKQLLIDKLMSSEYIRAAANGEEVLKDALDAVIPLKNFITKYFLPKLENESSQDTPT